MTRANRGRQWERAIERQNDAYRRERRAVVFRVHPEPGNRAKGPVDFVGVLAGPRAGLFSTEDGTAIAFDAKEGRGPRWSFSNLKPHQARDLEAAHVAGGMAGIALRLGDRAWWVSWAWLGPLWWEWREGAKVASITVAWLESLCVEMEGADWLSAIVKTV